MWLWVCVGGDVGLEYMSGGIFMTLITLTLMSGGTFFMTLITLTLMSEGMTLITLTLMSGGTSVITLITLTLSSSLVTPSSPFSHPGLPPHTPHTHPRPSPPRALAPSLHLAGL